MTSTINILKQSWLFKDILGHFIPWKNVHDLKLCSFSRGAIFNASGKLKLNGKNAGQCKFGINCLWIKYFKNIINPSKHRPIGLELMWIPMNVETAKYWFFVVQNRTFQTKYFAIFEDGFLVVGLSMSSEFCLALSWNYSEESKITILGKEIPNKMYACKSTSLYTESKDFIPNHF